MKKKVLALVVVVLLLTTGCSKSYIETKNHKSVTYSKTGQVLPNNILCKPSDEDLYNVYKKYDKQLNISLKKLPKCENFKINSNKSSSLWEGAFVKPLAYVILKLGEVINNYGLSVLFIGIAIRVVLLPFAYKTQKQSENMKKAQPEIQKIEKKYANKTDQDSMMAKSQETMALYKKYNINPMGSCLLAFIQLPLFFAFLQAINRVPAIFEGTLFGLKLGMTPLYGLKHGNYFYLILIGLIILSTYYSFKKSLAQSGSDEQAKQMKSMLIFMLAIIVFSSFSLSTAIAYYWVVTNGFIVIQNYVFDLLNKRKK